MNAPRLLVQPRLLLRAGHLWMAILAVYWCSLLLFSAPGGADDGVDLLLAATGIGMMFSAWSWGRALADGVRVLRALPVPRTLWRSWLHTVLGHLLVRWAVAVCAGTAAAFHAANLPWSGPAFLFSVAAMLGMVGALSHHGVWHWAWSWAITIACGLLALSGGWHGIGWLLHQTAFWHVGIALAWPMVMAALAWRWREQPPQAALARRCMQFNPLRLYANHAKRYTALNDAMARRITSGRQGGWTTQAMAPVMVYAGSQHIYGLHAHWGSEVGLAYLGTLLLPMLAASAMVSCKDLHWRRLLAPDGFRRGRLGWHIIVSTLTVNTAPALFIVACAAALAMGLGWESARILFAHPLRDFAPYSVFALEYVLAICVGVAIRGTRRPQLTVAVIVFGAAIAMAVAHILFDTRAMRGLFVIGPAYTGGLLIATLAAIMLANRVWTTQRLLPYVVAGGAPDEEAVEGGRWFFWPGRAY